MNTYRFAIWLTVVSFFGSACNFSDRNNIQLSKGSVMSGKVISIIDGDTYDVMVEGNQTLRVRMEGIDAPERGMPFYRVSKNYLSQLCYNEVVELKITGVDNHERVLAFAYLEDGRELSHELIRVGLAWHFKRYNSDRSLSILEREARKFERGLWADDNPLAPWTYRSLRRQGKSASEIYL